MDTFRAHLEDVHKTHEITMAGPSLTVDLDRIADDGVKVLAYARVITRCTCVG